MTGRPPPEPNEQPFPDKHKIKINKFRDDRLNASLVVGAVSHAAGHTELETDKQRLNG